VKTPTTNNIDKKDWIMILGRAVGVSLASFVLYNGLSTTLRLWQKWSMTTTTTTKRA
jgi:hypothetical protein